MTIVATSDYQRLHDDAGLVDRSDRGKLLLTGADVAEFLQGQLTNDIEALAPSTGCYAALLTHKGKLRADMRVLRGDDWLQLDTEPATLALVLKTMRMYSLGRDVRVADVTSERAILSLVGPAAAERLDVQPPPVEHAFAEGEHGLYVRTDLGVDIVCAAADVEAVRAEVDVEAVSDEAAECVRIEAGRPRLGRDMDADTLPAEAGINERAVSFTKGCYVGQETVARLHHRGRPNRHLRGLRLSVAAEAGEPIALGDRLVGRLGSTCVSPALGPIALAIVRREVEPGEAVAVGENGTTADVVELPFRVVD